MRIGILEPDGFSPVARQWLATLGRVEDYFGSGRDAFLVDKDALFIRLAHKIDADFLSCAPRLGFLCSPTTGHTHIDLDALSRKGVVLLSLRGATTFLEEVRATPEHALGLIIALLRNYRDAFVDEKNNHWDRDRCRGEEIAGTRVGLIGFGRVGRRLAAYLDVLGAEIGCYDPHTDDVPQHVHRCNSLADLIAAGRVIVLAASYAEGMPHIIDAAAVAALRGKYFVNVARGELTDEDALIAAIENGQLAGCAVDVISNETNQDNRDRWIKAARSSNVILTPHIGGATFKSMRMTEEFIAQRLLDAVAPGNQRRGSS